MVVILSQSRPTVIIACMPIVICAKSRTTLKSSSKYQVPSHWCFLEECRIVHSPEEAQKAVPWVKSLFEDQSGFDFLKAAYRMGFQI